MTIETLNAETDWYTTITLQEKPERADGEDDSTVWKFEVMWPWSRYVEPLYIPDSGDNTHPPAGERSVIVRRQRLKNYNDGRTKRGDREYNYFHVVVMWDPSEEEASEVGADPPELPTMPDRAPIGAQQSELLQSAASQVLSGNGPPGPAQSNESPAGRGEDTSSVHPGATAQLPPPPPPPPAPTLVNKPTPDAASEPEPGWDAPSNSPLEDTSRSKTDDEPSFHEQDMNAEDSIGAPITPAVAESTSIEPVHTANSLDAHDVALRNARRIARCMFRKGDPDFTVDEVLSIASRVHAWLQASMKTD